MCSFIQHPLLSVAQTNPLLRGLTLLLLLENEFSALTTLCLELCCQKLHMVPEWRTLQD